MNDLSYIILLRRKIASSLRNKVRLEKQCRFCKFLILLHQTSWLRAPVHMILGTHKNGSSDRSQITIFRGGCKQLSLWLWSLFGIVPEVVKDIFSRIIAWRATIHVLRPHIYPLPSPLITVSPAGVWCGVRGWASRCYYLRTVLFLFYQFSLMFL